MRAKVVFRELWELHKAHLDAHGWVGPRRRAGGCLGFGFSCNLGTDAGARAFLGMAVRYLSWRTWGIAACRSGGGLVCLIRLDLSQTNVACDVCSVVTTAVITAIFLMQSEDSMSSSGTGH
jgi:hypothetical protein